MSMQNFTDFRATEVPLAGTNLIEASAGTGKTYSIAVLVLRLILETKLPLKEILMVTFTKAAVAELEDRIRLFIRQAYQISQGQSSKDETISFLVERAAKQTSPDQVNQSLKEALLYLDETSVMTIHSFCQQSLTNFAFETGQLFGMETIQDSSAMIEDAVNSFWRKYVTIIPVDLLEQLCGADFTRHAVIDVIKQFLNGKRYLPYSEKENYTLCNEDYQNLWKDVNQLIHAEKELRSQLENYVREHLARLQQAAVGNTYARKAEWHLINDPVKLAEEIYKKRDKGYAQKLFQDIIEQCEDCERAKEERNEYVRHVIDKILCLAIQEVSKLIIAQKQKAQQMSFDDMIVDLHKALVKKDNPSLINGLQQRYKAVFIDEFQDTDRLQYEIFERAFGTNTILFYIGDPKQSIYAFRKADIFTYFKAKQDVNHRYSMNVNYRSSAPFINAMNAFFLPRPDFDTFYFSGLSDSIGYINVEAPEQNTKGVLMQGDREAVTLTLFREPKKDRITDATAALVVQLLSGDHYSIKQGNEQRRLTPADIGILVRSNKDGQKIKAALSRFEIPAVTLGDAKILASEEAVTVLYLLEAMLNLSRSAINRALLGILTGWDESAILKLNEETAATRFKSYKAAWENDGIYTALSEFLVDFGVYDQLIKGSAENGERIMSNLLQLMEILHKMQTHKQLSPLELTGWLRRGIDGMAVEGDEFEQRIESDEEAVKIVTIHKSKGLEYKVVIAPFLDFLANVPDGFCTFRDAQSGEYIAALASQMNSNQKAELLRQTEQENRRLLYVAITRAVYACFIFKNMGNSGQYPYATQSSLVPFVGECENASNSYISFNETPPLPETTFRWRSRTIVPASISRQINFKLRNPNWMRLSYSRLNSKHATTGLPKAIPQQDIYNDFMFRELARGAKTGDLVHYLFEIIHFQRPKSWEHAVEQTVSRFAPQQQELLGEMLNKMIEQVLNGRIQLANKNFSLAEVAQESKIHEFEFDFPFSAVDTQRLQQLSAPDRRIYVELLNASGGLVNGKMDMFFEFEGMYFILDWKSNYLGDTLEDYSANRLAEAMNERNYHLQYLIYTLAADKYLSSRLPDYKYDLHFGGIIYAFIRGVQKDITHGFFTTRPNEKTIASINAIFNKQTDDLADLVAR